MTDELSDYLNYRLQRSSETFNDAKLLARHESWNSCVNRLYYACFYAVNALLYSKGIEPKTHKGVRIKFLNEFIKTGIIDKNFGKLYTDLFDLRQEGDYSDFITFDKELVYSFIDKCDEFLIRIEAMIKSNMT